MIDKGETEMKKINKDLIKQCVEEFDTKADGFHEMYLKIERNFMKEAGSGLVLEHLASLGGSDSLLNTLKFIKSSEYKMVKLTYFSDTDIEALAEAGYIIIDSKDKSNPNITLNNMFYQDFQESKK
ncbi:hypothetical protein [Bartonella sp. DGB1]|uniref:hypothetical protein n=1 Tax=Bartonella sp. DGB1 TaxID=3239807 RepID=UPI003524B498